MEQHESNPEYPSSTAPDDMAFQNLAYPQNPFDVWGGDFQQYALQDSMNWLSGNNEPLLMSNQAYPGVPMGDTAHIPVYPSQLYAVPSYQQPQVYEKYTPLMPINDNIVSRPPSADTQMNSSSSSLSRPSSNASSPPSRAHKFKVPMLKTQFENQGRAMTLESDLSDDVRVADSESMTALSGEWLQMNESGDQSSAHESLSGVELKASPGLLEPFQWTSPVGRRESMSSAASGPVFSPFGTPMSSMWQHSVSGSPYPVQHGWTPTGNPGRFSISPQSPHQQRRAGAHPLRRPNLQYTDGPHHNKYQRYASNSLPSRKTRIARNVSDSAVPSSTTAHSYNRARSVGPRPRTEKLEQMSFYQSQQLALPHFQPGALFTSPEMGGPEFQEPAHLQTPSRIPLPPSNTQTPRAPSEFTPRHSQTPSFGTPPIREVSYFYGQTPRSHPLHPIPSTSVVTPAHQQPLPTPSEPPASDFAQDSPCASSSCNDGSSACSHSHPSASGPIRQSPHFEGDIYTPRYKRRNAAGKWEGWCGYCQPGRWLDLKNSRFWEDKLRNHGICARTKTFFEGPIRVRWISDRGTIWEGETGDSGFDPAGQQGVDDDGVGRKREGLCGECNTWVQMDGMRSRGRGKCVAWWMHAYKCHEQSRARTDGPAFE